MSDLDVPDLSSIENSEEEEWHEIETTSTLIHCLFCSNTYPTMEETLAHGDTVHKFRLQELKEKFNMDCYSYIKLINYIKTHKPSSEKILAANSELWNDEKYLQPVENDEWLMLDFDYLEEQNTSPKTYHANVENGLVTLSHAHFVELQRTIESLKEQLVEKQTMLQMANDDISKMQVSMKSFILGESSSNVEESSSELNSLSKMNPEDDQGYFNTYAHFGIHYEMLVDKVRTESYKNAILNNNETVKDKIILDLGCGTGILSMFAASAGAKKVYGIDQSEIIYQAMDIVRENNLHEVIHLVKGRLENTKLEEKVDMIISEWMGYFLLFEGMLDSVIYARDNYLKPGGLMVPNRCTISLVANGDVETHEKLINFWSDVYGYKMNCMKLEVVKEASIDIVSPKYIMSEPYVVKTIDINTCTTDVMNFTSNFNLKITENGYLTSLVGYFDTFFDLPKSSSFSTGPHATPTHWKQTVFFFRDCFQIKKGDIIEGQIICHRQMSDVRAISVQINIFGQKFCYVLC